MNAQSEVLCARERNLIAAYISASWAANARPSPEVVACMPAGWLEAEFEGYARQIGTLMSFSIFQATWLQRALVLGPMAAGNVAPIAGLMLAGFPRAGVALWLPWAMWLNFLESRSVHERLRGFYKGDVTSKVNVGVFMTLAPLAALIVFHLTHWLIWIPCALFFPVSLFGTWSETRVRILSRGILSLLAQLPKR